MTTFTKITTLAVAALVMVSTSAMAANMKAGGAITNITPTQRALATGVGTANPAASSVAQLSRTLNGRSVSFEEASFARGRMLGYGDAVSAMRGGGSGSQFGGLSGGSIAGLGGIGGFGGANCGTTGISAALCSTSYGVGQLAQTASLVGGLTGVNLGQNTLARAAGYANIAGGVTNVQNWNTLGSNLQATGNQLVADINTTGQYFVAAGSSALDRRTPIDVGATSALMSQEQINAGVAALAQPITPTLNVASGQ